MVYSEGVLAHFGTLGRVALEGRVTLVMLLLFSNILRDGNDGGSAVWTKVDKRKETAMQRRMKSFICEAGSGLCRVGGKRLYMAVRRSTAYSAIALQRVYNDLSPL